MPSFRLVSSSGDQSFELPPGRTLVVGRGVATDIAIYDPTISRRHAELTARGDAVELRDLGSSNGTCINGSRVSTGRLVANDSVTFGKVTYKIREARAGGMEPLPLPEPPVQGGTIVRQLMVSGGGTAGITSRDGPLNRGQLRVAAASAEERQAKKLSLLLEVAQKLTAELELDRLLRTVVDMTFQVMEVDRVTILLRHETTGAMVPTLSKSRLGDTQVQPVPRSIVDKVVEERVAVVSHNTPADERFKGRSIVTQSVRSAMCSPLLDARDQILGLLYVDNLSAPGSFSDEDLQFLVAFSGLAALGIKNSRFAEQSRREALVRSNFERYFAPNIAAAIAQQDGAIRVGGERRPITVLFSDIRGFTAIAESMGPDAVAQLLSEYFSEMVEVIFEHGGTLDKFIGDAVMALWGAPISHTDDPDRALGAAIAMQQAIEELNRGWAASGRPEIGVGIGISHGEVFAGIIGSHRRLEYTVLGDAVNVAARLCA
ncbi:MAG: adenylate/guanylate cyclase domain-containing protein, partial [Gemmatimonadales bacterium]